MLADQVSCRITITKMMITKTPMTTPMTERSTFYSSLEVKALIGRVSG
jgi:hypothetical protein